MNGYAVSCRMVTVVTGGDWLPLLIHFFRLLQVRRVIKKKQIHMIYILNFVHSHDIEQDPFSRR